MPRIIRTLWFEEIGMMHEPIIDTPLTKLSIRQTLMITASGIVGLIFMSIFGFLPSPYPITIALVFVALGFILAVQPVKTLPIERSILYLINPSALKKPSKKPSGKIARKMPEKELVILADIANEPPKKLVVMLKDQSDNLLKNTKFSVFLEGKEIGGGITDEEGFSTVYFMPPMYGKFRLQVRPEGYAESVSEMTVEVKPRVSIR